MPRGEAVWALFQRKPVRNWLNEKKSLMGTLLLCSVGSCWGCCVGKLATVLHNAFAGIDCSLPVRTWCEDAFGVPTLPSGISSAGEQSMHLSMVEQR